MSAQVRTATLADAPRLAQLHAAIFDEKWNAEAFEIMLAVPGSFCLIAEEPPNALQGFILARAAAGEAEILSLGTLEPSRRRGLARSLVVAVAEEATRRGAGEIFLEVAADNAPALILYGALGFATVGTRPGYYRNLRGPAATAFTLRAALPLSL